MALDSRYIMARIRCDNEPSQTGSTSTSGTNITKLINILNFLSSNTIYIMPIVSPRTSLLADKTIAGY